MAIPSFQEFEWLHPQPSWAFEPDYRAAIRTARFERWQPLWKLCMVLKFSDYEVGELIRLKEEYESNILIKG